jgi:death-on-curing protein
MAVKRISVGEVESVAHALARGLLRFNEPIPAFKTRFPNALESCLITPFQSFGGLHPYPTLVTKAAMMFYLMVKRHPFQNGNKRVAMTTLLYFLHKNGKWIRVDNQELYNFAKWVAASNPKLQKATVAAINEFLRLYVIDLAQQE